MPFLDEAVCGCFVRVGIGAHEGRMVYRVREVVCVIKVWCCVQFTCLCWLVH